MRYLSLFSGIEAASVAWEPLGWEPVAFCEVDAFPSAVLAHRWPRVPNLGDITKVDWSDFAKGKRKPDVVVGGSPCQSFSVAGNREGLAGESGLMFEYIRAVQCIMPGCFVWENVPGAFTSENGEAFRQLLSEMDALGYGLAWRVLDAQFFGVAQRRERVFLVGCLGDPRRAARVLFEPDGLRWDTPSSRDKRQELAARAGRGPAGEGGAVAGFCAGNSAKASTIGYAVEQSPTLRAGESGTNMTPTVLTPTYQIAGNIIGRDPRNGGHQLGAVDPDENGAFTLTTNDLHAVAAPVNQECLTPWDVQSRRVYDVNGTWPALYAGEGGGHGYVLTEDGGSEDHPDRDRGRVQRPGRGLCGRGHARCDDGRSHRGEPGEDRLKPVCLGDDNSKAACDVDMCGALKVGGSAPIMGGAAYEVRRLMPVECERLQGFPDGHTDLTGADPDALFERMEREDMDEAERKRLRTKLRKWCKACPDTPRYKACGNSMAVPVMRWIGERIQMTEGGA